jgi:hypothetical protein
MFYVSMWLAYIYVRRCSQKQRVYQRFINNNLCFSVFGNNVTITSRLFEGNEGGPVSGETAYKAEGPLTGLALWLGLSHKGYVVRSVAK